MTVSDYDIHRKQIIISFLVFNAIMLSFHLFSCIFYESIGLALVFLFDTSALGAFAGHLNCD